MNEAFDTIRSTEELTAKTAGIVVGIFKTPRIRDCRRGFVDRYGRRLNSGVYGRMGWAIFTHTLAFIAGCGCATVVLLSMASLVKLPSTGI
jgi:hypothetical protein